MWLKRLGGVFLWCILVPYATAVFIASLAATITIDGWLFGLVGSVFVLPSLILFGGLRLFRLPAWVQHVGFAVPAIVLNLSMVLPDLMAPADMRIRPSAGEAELGRAFVISVTAGLGAAYGTVVIAVTTWTRPERRGFEIIFPAVRACHPGVVQTDRYRQRRE